MYKLIFIKKYSIIKYEKASYQVFERFFEYKKIKGGDIMSERILVRDLREGDELIGDILYEGKVLLKKGSVLTALQAERLHKRFKDLNVSVNVHKVEQEAESLINEQSSNDQNAISSISGYCEKKTVEAIQSIYDKLPEEWQHDELGEIKYCMGEIVNNVKSSECLCYNLHDFTADDKKERHLYRVAKMAVALANVYNSTVPASAQINLTSIGMAALFHDYGKRFKNRKSDISKLKIEVELLRKLNLHPQFFKNPYEPSLHSVYAYSSLKNNISEQICKIVLFSGLHNSIVNKFDSEIPEVKAAKAIALCYEYDNLLEDVIKNNLSNPLENVLCVIDQGVENGKFSKKAYKLFMDNILIYAPGTMVLLSNGEYATVVSNNRNFPSRPIVFTDRTRGTPRLIDLVETTNITIEQILLEGARLNRKINKIESTQLKNIVSQDDDDK